MRFNLGPPPEGDAFLEGESAWHPVNEPSQVRLLLAAVVIGVLITGCIASVIIIRDPEYIADVSWPTIILLFIPLVPIHEILHASCFPGGLTSKRVVIGFYPKAAGFYAHYDGIISWYRYILIAALPLLLVSVIPLIIATLINLKWSYLTEMILANGLLSGVDVLTIVLILRQVPRHSLLINSGMKTYWKRVVNRPPESVTGPGP